MIKTVKQHDPNDCGAACLVSILSHFKLNLPIAKVRQYTNTTSKGGTNLLGIVEGAKSLGFESKAIRTKLDNLESIPLPALAYVVIKLAGDERLLPHFVVLYKVDAANVYIMDPSYGTLIKKTKAEFSLEWQGILVLFEPGPNLQNTTSFDTVAKKLWNLYKSVNSNVFQSISCYLSYISSFCFLSSYVSKLPYYIVNESEGILLNTIYVFCILSMQFGVFIIKNYFLLRNGEKIDKMLMAGYHEHVIKLPQMFFDSMTAKEIISRATDARRIRLLVNELFSSLLINILLIITTLLFVTSISVKLFALCLFIALIYVLINAMGVSIGRIHQRKLSERSAVFESAILESITNISAIKQFNMEKYTLLNARKKFAELSKFVKLIELNEITVYSISNYFVFSFILTILFAGYFQFTNKIIQYYQLVFFYFSCGLFMISVVRVTSISKNIANAIPSANRFFGLMDLEKESNKKTTSFNVKDIVGKIIFKDIEFSYKIHEAIFKNLSFEIEIAKTTVIAGKSKSGKSAIAYALQGLYNNKSGHIYINKMDIFDLNLYERRNLVIIVPQDDSLFIGTISHNIAVGTMHPDTSVIYEICKSIGLYDIITSYPRGFDTIIGENGQSLPVSQRKLIMIARALYKNPKILVLDEPALSFNELEKAILEKVIRKLNDAGTTIIILTQYPHFFQNVDKVLVIADGQLLEVSSGIS